MNFVVFSLLLLVATCIRCNNVDDLPFKLSLTVSAKLGTVDVSWYNLDTPNVGYILLTDNEPTQPFHKYEVNVVEPQLPSTQIDQRPPNETLASIPSTARPNLKRTQFTYGNGNATALYWVKPTEKNGWVSTSIEFNSDLLKSITKHTKCYGYWAIYLNNALQPVASTCMRAYATWMNDERDNLKHFRIRDLFIVGTHDSASYRTNFNASSNDTLVTKYALTQSDDITTQLMHGVRYLDVRIGYYRATQPNFWVNHGITRQQPLHKVLQQVRDFVMDTDEIVIFDIQEFPVGFGKNLDIHRKLVQYIHSEIGELLVDPSGTWDVRLENIWQSRRNIILGYDYVAIVQEFPSIVFQSVQQRWGNVQRLDDLKRFLAPRSNMFQIFSSRPQADMAEITPTTWDVISDRYGGLRRMADRWNRNISKWYFDEWGMSTKIVALDFYRGTNLMDSAIYWNSKKDRLRQMRRK